MGRRAEAVERTRRRIELALIRVLALKSYGSITMADIAREADVSVRTVHRHFRGKDEVLTACSHFLAQMLPEELARHPEPSSPQGAIRRLVEALFALYERHNAEVWAIYTRAMTVPELGQSAGVGNEVRLQAIEELMGRWPGVWAVGEERAKRVLASLTSYPAWRSFTDRKRFSTPEAVDIMTSLLCGYLLGG